MLSYFKRRNKETTGGNYNYYTENAYNNYYKTEVESLRTNKTIPLLHPTYTS